MEEECAIVRILVSKIGWCKEKLKARERSCSMDLKPWVLTDSVEWCKGPREGEEGWLFYCRYNPALLPPRLPSLWHAGLQSLCSILLCFYKFEYVYKFHIWKSNLRYKLKSILARRSFCNNWGTLFKTWDKDSMLIKMLKPILL